MEGTPDALASVIARLETLERRVYVLEHPSEMSGTAELPVIVPPQATRPVPAIPAVQAGNNFVIVGKAMLGIAGAYLLRAAAESGVFPKFAIVAIAFAYACTWLVWAARTRSEGEFASTTYAATSALILAPMLWELTLRFNVLQASWTAALLGTFVLAGTLLAWKRNLASVFWIVNITAVLASLALLLATHDMVPFIWGLLFMSLIGEFAAARGRRLGVRLLVALAADVAICALIYIYYDPANVPTDYRVFSAAALLLPSIALLLIYAMSDAFQTSILRRPISYFDTGQAAIAFLLAAVSVLRFGSGVGGTALGAFCLFFAAAGYAVVFAYFVHSAEQRNFHVYGTGSAALFVAGSILAFSATGATICLCAAALVATVLGVRRKYPTLEFHGLVYLAAASFPSGLAAYAGHTLMGEFPSAPAWTVWMVAASAIVCSTVVVSIGSERWPERLLHLMSAALGAFAGVTLLLFALVSVASIAAGTGTPYVAVIRTLATCSAALALAFIGSRWQRVELVWIAYGALAFVAAKLLFEDLRYGHPGSIAASIFLFAVTLILVPRLVRHGQIVGNDTQL
jgi:hypothetical protein